MAERCQRPDQRGAQPLVRTAQASTPTSFQLDQVIKGWTEGVQLMVEGEKTRFWIPERLAYGGEKRPYGALVFVGLVRWFFPGIRDELRNLSNSISPKLGSVVRTVLGTA